MASKKPKLKEQKKVLGVPANIRNILIAVAMIFAFLGSFFQLYSWIDTTYAKQENLVKVKVENDYRWETTVLQSMYARMWVLDNMVSLAPDPSKVSPDTRTEYNDLKAKIKLQEEKVRLLQEKLTK